MLSEEDVKLWRSAMEGTAPLHPRRASAAFRTAVSHTVRQRPMIEPRIHGMLSLDLHGMTIQKAHETVDAFVRTSRQRGEKRVLVITGRSGDICREFPEWMSQNPVVRRTMIRRDRGSFIVTLASTIN
jgi:DNA-nicking Smr family endonuclease